MVVSPNGGRNGGGRTRGGGDLRLMPPEHSRTVHCIQFHCGHVSGGGAASGVKAGPAVVGIGRLGIGRYADGGLEGGTDGEREGDGQNGDREGINRWEDTVANVILGTEHNAPLASAPLLELRHLTMILPGGNGDWLDRTRVYWKSFTTDLIFQ